ncbi:hypothetical protein TL16_g03547 [Triparma laevis f. inornata]|uniref:Uncharacterized protein n=1 Tax=Triparma laevis f. inornata TaxID=1714386 RepID=A0A9W6ZZG2_9STRA|nr:hypothetical protein TL16_g03547 [Triparma laevis f. inornata]
MIIVFISYSNQSWYTLLWELLFVITLVKPGVDCYWVIQHQKQKANAALDPLTEMVYIKEVELITDCIPGAVIQAIAFVNGQHSYIAVVSLMSNVPTAAFIAASMALEKDIGVLCLNGAIGSLVALQTICYISFLAIIEPKYRKTFLGTTTASQMTMAKFQETRDDHVKLEFTFDVHPSLWAPIKDEVKNWVNEALRLWIREQPDWFDDHAKASIPDNFVTD